MLFSIQTKSYQTSCCTWIRGRVTLLAECDALRGELRLVTAQRDLAEEKPRAYEHELFGASSEARHADQLGLFNEAEALAMTTDAPAREDMPGRSVAAHTRGKRGRKPLDPNLPREVVRHELPESERYCAHDGHALVEIDVETSEQLDVIPEQVRVVQHQRVKYACPCCDLGITVTPAPARIIPRGPLTESALAWIITGKYQYGMPLYRQATLLRCFGGDISSNTLAASVVRVGLATQPVINLMRDALLESDLSLRAMVVAGRFKRDPAIAGLRLKVPTHLKSSSKSPGANGGRCESSMAPSVIRPMGSESMKEGGRRHRRPTLLLAHASAYARPRRTAARHARLAAASRCRPVRAAGRSQLVREEVLGMRGVSIPFGDLMKRRCEERHVGGVAERILLLVDERGGLRHPGGRRPNREPSEGEQVSRQACQRRARHCAVSGRQSDPVYAWSRPGD
ncbi:IS66 family transposase zinc-finger binding domain-containing protein [Burkholderia vietnamiensis]|uniref:IS66 family transposase zinc-finger binding domain-containing protein n=1 Tax=Burkholderia vietnamiensis TaxID=60552 RepID=UPI001CF34808|nr:IS66 family transposase zinc-finger binding domain-containing protein [Burkholderia vietnamiensis]MCA7944907.1 IS66 family transposase zinc-finger binding domain-containing protein [Burkholderia vietnamiensis]